MIFRGWFSNIAGQLGIAAGSGASSAATTRTVAATDSPEVTALQIMDDWDESDRAKVNPIVGVAGVAAGAGTVGTTTQRTTLASDDPAVTALQIMDDWDETNRAAVNTIAGQVGVQGAAGAVTALTQRMVLATDDAAVTALQVIDDWDESDRAKVNPIAGQAGVAAGAGAVSALVQRMTLASDDPAVTALQILDNAISGSEMQVDVVGALPAGTAIIGATYDAGPTWTQSFGISGAVVTSADMTTSAAVTDAPTGGQKLVIDDILLSADTAMFVIFEIETTGTDLLKIWVPANGTVQFTPRGKLKLATADKKLFADASVAGNLAVTCFYHSEA